MLRGPAPKPDGAAAEAPTPAVEAPRRPELLLYVATRTLASLLGQGLSIRKVPAGAVQCGAVWYYIM